MNKHFLSATFSFTVLATTAALSQTPNPDYCSCRSDDAVVLNAIDKSRGLSPRFEGAAILWAANTRKAGQAVKDIDCTKDKEVPCEVKVFAYKTVAGCETEVEACRICVGRDQLVRFRLYTKTSSDQDGTKLSWRDGFEFAGDGEHPRGIEIHGAISGRKKHFIQPNRKLHGVGFWWMSTDVATTDRLAPFWPLYGLAYDAHVRFREDDGGYRHCIPRDPIIVNTGD